MKFSSYVMGNHDYLLHGCFNEEERKKDTDRLLAKNKSTGITVGGFIN